MNIAVCVCVCVLRVCACVLCVVSLLFGTNVVAKEYDNLNDDNYKYMHMYYVCDNYVIKLVTDYHV